MTAGRPQFPSRQFFRETPSRWPNLARSVADASTRLKTFRTLVIVPSGIPPPTTCSGGTYGCPQRHIPLAETRREQYRNRRFKHRLSGYHPEWEAEQICTISCWRRLRRRQPGHWTPMSLACMRLRLRKLRATGQRRISLVPQTAHCVRFQQGATGVRWRSKVILPMEVNNHDKNPKDRTRNQGNDQQ